MLRSDLCDYSDVYVDVNGTIDLLAAAAANKNDKAQKDFRFKYSALFRSCISKISGTSIDIARDLDIVMLMYFLLEYSDNYSMASGSLWNYYRDNIDGVTDNDSKGNF